MIAKRPHKILSDKETEFKGAFQQLCDSVGILTYTLQSETKSAFAERYNQSLEDIVFKNTENK